MGNCTSKRYKLEETYKNIKPYVPQITEGIVVNVYDGNTITIISKLHYKESELSYDESEYYRFSVRLFGIDIAENETAKKALSVKILNHNVTLRDVTTDKYGRILANVYLDNECINDWMLNNGYAIAWKKPTR